MRCADCQVPQVTARATEAATPESLFELFRDWQRKQTQSAATALTSPRQQMDVRFCTMQEPSAERHTCAATDLDPSQDAPSAARTESRAFLLTTDLHGRRSLARNAVSQTQMLEVWVCREPFVNLYCSLSQSLIRVCFRLCQQLFRQLNSFVA
jgi:hypothetical protein